MKYNPPMPLTPGTRLGPYEIVAPLGAGGMGEVYRAHDTRLSRDVAVKVLPQHLSSNPEVRVRFEREAKTVSSLNHPHICTLFDVGREGDTDFLVMELIEGETLAHRLLKGALPVPEVLRLGAQIADALDRAHRSGVVHRDLKPGNVMLTKAGAKLMDFGLARATGLGGPESGWGTAMAGVTQSPTVAQPLTAEGTIIGTFQYMSPEQLEGKEADGRSDIWALGCVLYEMATGRRAYEGTTQASLISAIMRDTPRPMAELAPMSPPALERLVTQCLAKDPDDRWQSARDLGRELGVIAADPSAGRSAPTSASHRPGITERLAWLTLVVLLAAGSFLLLRARGPRDGGRVISAILAPPGAEFATRTFPMAVSPDGRRIAFVCEDSTGATSLWVRSFDGQESRLLPGTEDAQMPFWSPDGGDLGFFANGQLKRTSLAGGLPQILAPETSPAGACWSRSGFILFAGTRPERLMRVPEHGGEAVAALDSSQIAGSRYPGWPTMLPDDRHFLFGSSGAIIVQGMRDGLYAASLEGGGKPQLILSDAKNAAYLNSGQLLFWRSGALWAQAFDASHLSFSGSPNRIADRVALNVQLACGLFSAGASGPVVYLQESNAELTELAWVDRAGRDLGTLAPPGLHYWPRLSHDGRRVAMDLSDAVSNQGDIWIFDVARRLGDRFTSDPLNETAPMWSRDDSRLYWMSSVGAKGTGDIHSRSLQGGGREEVTYSNPDVARPLDLTPDGRTLLIGRRSNDSRGGLDVLQLSLVDGKVAPVLDSDYTEACARLSLDGRWLLYVSDESGQFEVYVQRFPEGSEKWRVSTRGGVSPVWRGDGREIFYAGPDRHVLSVSFRAEPTVEIGSPVPLFREDLALDGSNTCFDVTADGERFLINRLVGTGGATTLTLDQGWKPPK